ncbi:IclR family transcriptional regulator [Haloplanus litoreus]|uniref:IclR family transcriptional regulator n=1 Tax=Haloplanus litoreus TaxID=767515 RepID=A0ABD6A2B5_9EURY
MDTDSPRTVQSVDRACTILEHIRQAGNVTLTELAEKMDLSLGSLQAYMNSLCQNGFVVKENREYTLAPQFLTYGEHVRNNLPLYRVGREVVDTMAHETGNNAHLITNHGGREVTLYQAFGENSVGSDLYIWHQAKLDWQLHWSASGKAILANLPPEQARDIVRNNALKRRTPHTITDDEALFEELERIRERGYALNDEEELLGLRAVAAPIHGDEGQLLGSVSLSAPKSQMTDDYFYNKLPNYVINKANIIEVELQAEDSYET